jgi:peptidoglycan/xylan/chitin deacetylase (PgdA/CDA1 family)
VAGSILLRARRHRRSLRRPMPAPTCQDGPVGRPAVSHGAGTWAVKRLAATFDSVRRPPGGIVVLGYHRVGRRSSLRVDLPEWLFDEQMARLAQGPGTVSLDEALSALTGDAPPGSPPVVVTFDDGTNDFVEVALPILVRHHVPATLYVSTDFVERGRAFPNNGVPASWAALASAVSTGLVTIGSHTHTHALLDRLPGSAISAELDRSIDLIGDRLGVRARHFAYPKALAGSAAADQAVRARFASAALAGTRPNPYRATDPYCLARSPIQVEDGLSFFARKVGGGMHIEDDLRQAANRLRFRGATT